MEKMWQREPGYTRATPQAANVAGLRFAYPGCLKLGSGVALRATRLPRHALFFETGSLLGADISEADGGHDISATREADRSLIRIQRIRELRAPASPAPAGGGALSQTGKPPGFAGVTVEV